MNVKGGVAPSESGFQTVVREKFPEYTLLGL